MIWSVESLLWGNLPHVGQAFPLNLVGMKLGYEVLKLTQSVGGEVGAYGARTVNGLAAK